MTSNQQSLRSKTHRHVVEICLSNAPHNPPKGNRKQLYNLNTKVSCSMRYLHFRYGTQ